MGILISRRNRIAGFLFLFGTLGGALLSGCWFEIKKPIRIGYIGSYSDKNNDLGRSARDGARVAVRELNDQGGISGHSVELVFRDDEADPALGLQMAQELEQLHVQAIVGPFLSSVAEKIFPFVNSKQMVTIAPVVASLQLSHLDDSFIKMFPTVDLFGARVGKYLRDQSAVNEMSNTANKTRVAIVYDEDHLNDSLTFISALEKEIQGSKISIVSQKSFSSKGIQSEKSELRLPALVQSVMSLHPESIVLISNPFYTAEFCKYFKRESYSGTLISSVWGIGAELQSSLQQSVDGLLFFVPFEYQWVHQDYQQFQRLFTQQTHSAMTYAAAYNYDAVMLLAHALRGVGEKEVAEIRGRELKKRILELKSHEGVQGRIVFDEFGDSKRTLVLHVIRNGQIVRAE